jgi:hypothetical protein
MSLNVKALLKKGRQNQAWSYHVPGNIKGPEWDNISFADLSNSSYAPSEVREENAKREKEMEKGAPTLEEEEEEEDSEDDGVLMLGKLKLTSLHHLPLKVSLHKFLVKMKAVNLIKIPKSITEAREGRREKTQDFWLILGSDNAEKLMRKLFWMVYFLKFNRQESCAGRLREGVSRYYSQVLTSAGIDI